MPAANNDGFFSHHGLWAPGVRLFRRLQFESKALLISLAFMVPMLGLTIMMLIDGGQTSRQARMDATRQHVEVAHSVLAWAHAQELAGTLTREQAQDTAARAVATLRYDGQEYFWINDMTPRVVMHPTNPKLNGQDVSQLKDPNGFALFSAFVDTVRREGKGFVAYQWPKPGSKEPVDKLSYVLGFEPWGWVVGSGIYVDDLAATQRERVGMAGLVIVGVSRAEALRWWPLRCGIWRSAAPRPLAKSKP